MTIRETARRVGVAPSTAFRWRHRFLSGLAARDPEPLGGRIELATIRVVESRKGQRALGRPSRRRGVGLGLQRANLIAVVTAIDRTANVRTAAFPARRIDASMLMALLGPEIARSTILVAAEGRFGPTSLCSRRLGCAFQDARQGQPGADPGIEDARSCSRRLSKWLRRFRGVATKYLSHYLAWHRYLEYPERRGIGVSAPEWSVIEASPTTHNSREHSRTASAVAGPRPPRPPPTGRRDRREYGPRPPGE